MKASNKKKAKSLTSFAHERAQKYSRNLLNLFLVAIFILPIIVISVNYYTRTEAVFKGIEESIRYSLISGDVYLKRQLSSLVSGDLYDFAWIEFKKSKLGNESKKIIVSRNQDKKIGLIPSGRFFTFDYSLYWVYRDSINDYKGESLASLHLARPLPVLSFFLWAILIGIFYSLLSRQFSSSLQGMAKEIANPLTQFYLLLKKVRSHPKAFDKPLNLSSDFLEVKMAINEFRGLWNEKMKAEKIAKAALKNALEVKVGSHLRHDLDSDFLVINAALTKMEGPEKAFKVIDTAIERAKNTVKEFPKVATMEVDEVMDYFHRGRDASCNDVFPIVQEVADEADLWADQSDPKVNLNIDLFPTKRKALLNPNVFKRALLNIIKNSFEAIYSHSKVSQGQITLKLHEEADSVVVTIEDNGKGMSTVEQERLSREGFSTKKGGSGLGMSSAMAIIKKWNGHIDINSQEGQGTTVNIFLPQILSEN